MPDGNGPPLPPGRRLELPGRGTTFIREMAGPPGAPTLVLLHGLGVSADLNWFRCYDALGRHYRVIAMDHRGHGRGIRSSRPFRLADCADDVAAVADELGIEQFIPVGYSMGGPITQFVWKRHPDRVAGLVLCATARSFTPRRASDRLLLTSLLGLSAAARVVPPQIRAQAMSRALRGRLQSTPLGRWASREVQRGDQAAILQAAWAVGSFDSRRWITDVDAPSAVVVTVHDQLVPAWRQIKMANAIPGATIHRVMADHGACVLAAQVFVPGLLDACASVSQRLPSTARS
jgi:3-oxoadipate enol-lactonase